MSIEKICNECENILISAYASLYTVKPKVKHIFDWEGALIIIFLSKISQEHLHVVLKQNMDVQTEPYKKNTVHVY